MRQRRGLTALEGFQEYGLLTEEAVASTLAQVRSGPLVQQVSVQAALESIAAAEAAAMTEVRGRMQATRSTGWVDRMIGAVEGLLDAGDAVRRRRRANRIYRDLAARRISESRAVRELQALTARQKGGWLRVTLDDWLSQWRSALQGSSVPPSSSPTTRGG